MSNLNLVTMMMQDGVDLDVINDVVEHPTRYIQMLDICDGEFIEIPLFCCCNEACLTAEQKTKALSILDKYICFWYSLGCKDWDKYVYPDDYDIVDVIDDTVFSACSDNDYFLSNEELKVLLAEIEDDPLDFS